MKKISKFLSVVLAACMIFGMLPALTVSAADAADPVSVKIDAPEVVPLYKDESYSYAERAVDLVSRMTEEEMISQTEGYNSPAISRLGVATYMWWNEALHGYNQEGWFGIQTDGSSFPSSYSMGASWDPEIYYREAVQIGAEIRERVKQNRYNLTMFSPTINLARDPRWGRNDEGYGEDPFVTGLLGSAFVNGVEGKTYAGEYIRKNANGEGVKQAGTTIKHYAANNSEKNRYTSGADNVTVREMREYYTRASRIVTKNADVSSVMMAYSSVSGVPISFSSYYMDTLLRQTYGFNGYIVSDCDSVAVSYNRSVHKNNPHTNANYTLGEGFANALANGLDLQCNAGETDSLGSYASNYSKLKAEADGSPVVTDKGYFTRQQAEVSVARLMTQRMKLGEFDEDNFYATEGKARLDAGNGGAYVNGVAGQTQERIDLADDLSRSTIVLLQNEDKALPITAEEISAADGYDVAIVGPVGQSNFRGGYSSTLRNEANVVTIEQAIKTAFADSSYYPQSAVDNVNINYYYGFSSSVSRNSFTRLQSSQIDVSQVAEDLDLAIVVVGQGSGDSREDGDRTDLNLAQAQIDMLKAVKAKNPKKLVLVMETYGPVQMVSDLTDGVDAILWSGFNGFRKGTGFGEAITGKNNPSGRMNATWLKDMINDTPGFFDYSLFPSNGKGGRTYMYNVEQTIYPFGFGLSYSDFAYAASGSMLGASAKNGLVVGTADAPITGDSTIDVSFQIKNNSDVPGKQVAEVYAVSPGAGTNNIPLKRLVGFDKVEVGANATVDVTIPVKVADLAFFNEEADCYELTPGTWKIWVAMSSDFNEATDLSEEFKIENGAIREDPAVVTVKLTQPGDDAKGISERVIFSLSDDASKNVIIPSLGVTMANEKLYGTRVVKNVPGVDIGVDAAAATEAGNGFASPDTAASLPRLEAGKTADELPHIGEKFTLPDTYAVEYTSNRPEVVAVEDGQLVMKGQGVATLTATVTGPSGVSASEEFTVCVKVEPGLQKLAIGVTKYKKFTPENYEINVTVPKGTAPDNDGLAIDATPVEGATVEYLSKDADGNFVPNESGKPRAIPDTVYIKVTGDELMEQIYAVNYIEGEAVKPSGTYVLASEVVPGGTYVIVANDEYALSYDADDGSFSAAEVAVRDGKIVGTVNETMLWTFNPAEGLDPASDGSDMYFVTGSDGNYLRRNSSALAVGEFDEANARYFGWSLIGREVETDAYTFYVNGSSRYAMSGAESGFSIARVSSSSGNIKTAGSPIRLYELSEPSLPNIDFTDPADAGKYEIVGKTQSEVEAGVGLPLIVTRMSIEPAKRPNTEEYIGAEDVVEVPVTGDWTATLNFDYDPNNGGGSYAFFSFFASQGDDYQNMLGIRGGDGAMQNFERHDGTVTHEDEEGVNSAPGFSEAGEFWFRIEKAGDAYTCYRSDDGEAFTEMFAYESSGIEATKLVIDAYSASSRGNGRKFTLKSLTFGEGSVTPDPKVNKAALEAAIAEAGEVDKTAYTEASVADLDAAVAAAEAIRDKADATQEEVDDAAQAVRDAIAALIKLDTADTAELEAAIAAAEAVERDKYTDESLANLDAKLAEARTALAESRLQAVIDTAAQALRDAIDTLVEKGGEPDGKYKLTDEIIPGANYIIVADGKYALNSQIGAAAVTIGDNKITSEVTEDMIWTIEEAEGVDAAADGADQYFITGAGGFLRRISGANAPQVTEFDEASARYFPWSVVEREEDTGLTLYQNGTSRYAITGTEAGFTVARVSSSSGNIRTAGSSIQLFTDGEVCEHDWVIEVVEPTCTEGGYTRMTCSKCGRVKITDKVPALGHDWVDGEILVAPTATEFGKQEIICSRCGEKSTKTLLPTELKEGPTLVKDPDSPTGYTARFVYKNDTDQQVYFNGDIGLRNDADRTDTKDYTPFEYRPGLMRGTGFKTEMENLGGGYWFYEVPLCCGANQYWFTVGSSDTMLPDPANCPIWSPTAQQKNAYNYLYVPYDEKQDYEVLKMREAENPRTDDKVGTWSYVPIEIAGQTQHIAVYLPYGYDAERAEPYKTIWILHGGGQDECDWMNIGSVQKIMDNLAAEGRTEPAVIVSPTTNNNQLGSTSDAYANLFNVVLPFVEENYNVSKDKMDRAFGGLSMGSMNTQNIINAQTDAEKFGYYGPWSGGVSVNAGVPGIEYAHILFAGGSNDFGWTASAPQSVENLIAQGVHAKYMTVTGAHDFNTWCQMFRIWCEDYLWKPEAFDDGPQDPKAELKEIIEAYEAIDTSVYTDDSVKAFEDALKAAKDVLAKEDATQEEISNAIENLKAAFNSIEPIDDFPFIDVRDPTKYYTEAVYWALNHDPQITKGTDATHFGPDNPCTRGHVVTFLWRAAGEPEPKSTKTPFTDLKPGAFYEKAVAWAVEEGITKGMTDTTFAPDGKCNRGQIVTFLWRFKGEPAPKSTQTPFTDLKAGAFYENAVAWAVENNVTKGMTETTFVPDATCTRGQVVTFLYRATQD